MRGMFFFCFYLRNLDLSSFKTNKVEDMGLMFRSCESLEFLNLTNFDFSSIKDKYYMFDNCPAKVIIKS